MGKVFQDLKRDTGEGDESFNEIIEKQTPDPLNP
jgi:hypothetical protein